jgi:thiol-disulfide isomerase/thioredoxin
MNRLHKTLRVSTLLLVLPMILLAQPGYNIQLKVNGLTNQDVILGFHMNKQFYVKDTVKVNDKGIGVFSGQEALPGGIYLFYLPTGKFFDVLINREQHFSVECDTVDFYKTMKIKGALEPQLFLDLQLFMEEKGSSSNVLKNQLKSVENDSVQKKLITDQMEAISQEVEQYWTEIETKHKGTFVATFVKAFQEVKIPEFEWPANTVNPDSVLQAKRIWYLKDHYFDNMDLSDSRLIRTPFFHHKLEKYYNQVLIPIPDTVINQSIRLIERARPNAEMFRYMVQFIFNFTNNSQIMGMDAAMVALGEKYYLSGQATWTTEEFIKNLRTRIQDLKPTLLGKTSQDLKMEGLHGEFYRLHEVNALITILVFYEPDCGHCKKEIPHLYKEVFEPYRNKGVQFFAVYNLNDRQKWEEFVTEHGLLDWINVYDPNNLTRFRNYYDIKTTPMIYVLDRNKKIIAKRIDSEQLPTFLDRTLSQPQR